MVRTPQRVLAGVAAAAAIAAGFAVAGGSAHAAATPAMPFPQHQTYKVGVMPSASQASRDAAVEKQYNSWKSSYLVHGCASNEYYVSTKGDGDATNNGTVSEAQGYGMNIVPLMAGYDADAQTEFNGLWQLVKDHKDQWGLMQWQLDGKSCKYYSSGTPDAATDGDLDIGYGLILADRQWGGYTADAKAWLASVYAHDVTSDGHLKCEDDGPSTDTRPSDNMLDHLRAFAAYDTAHDWTKVVDRMQAIVTEFTGAYSSSAGLMSDFVVNANTTSPSPAPANYQEDQPDNIVGYNSIRVPWHLGTDALLNGSTTAAVSYADAKKWSACTKGLAGGNPAKVQPHIKLNCANGNVSGDTTAEEAGDSIGPAAMAAGDQAWTDAIWSQLGSNPFGDSYYGETIKMLVYLVMAGDYWSPTAGAAGPSSSPSASPTQTPALYEAEASANTLAGGAKAVACASGCSGGSRVGYIGYSTSATGTLTINGVKAVAAGSYPLAISFVNGATSARTATVTVDGVAHTVSVPPLGTFSAPQPQTITIDVQLNAGSGNTIAFTNASSRAPDVDSVRV
ncbi:glycosyl hydrolase family 8 [Streptacidiphilus rugosus]|uniref:glycosyl hydrolase family 8 n=1 Tax=Streptacidiphilus rugosus TaxID=405783 RepID=UPI0007C7A9B5|nr:glycosyl hydrolase family 8 [Streptacidiphilus rugosus]